MDLNPIVGVVVNLRHRHIAEIAIGDSRGRRGEQGLNRTLVELLGRHPVSIHPPCFIGQNRSQQH